MKLALIALFLLIFFSPIIAQTQELEWAVTSNPSSNHDFGRGILADGDYIYVVGGDRTLSATNGRWRIEKRNKADGSMVSGWPVYSNPSSGDDAAIMIVSDATCIFVVGYVNSGTMYRIERRNKITGALDAYVMNNDPPQMISINIDDTYFYMTGKDSARWYIQKHSKNNFAMLWRKTVNPSSSPELPWDSIIDNNFIYVIGSDNSLGNYQWHIEKLLKSDGVSAVGWPITSNPTTKGDDSMAITADNNYLYIYGWQNFSLSPPSGEGRFEKRRKDTGALESAATCAAFVAGTSKPMVLDSDYIYLAGTQLDGSSNAWRIEKRRKSDFGMESDWPIVSNPSAGDDMAMGMTQDSDFIYIVGHDYIPGNYEWRIEKRRKGGFIDIGLRVWKNGSAMKIAAEPADPPTSAVRIAKAERIYGIALVDVSDPPDAGDSGIRVWTSSGVKALRKLE